MPVLISPPLNRWMPGAFLIGCLLFSMLIMVFEYFHTSSDEQRRLIESGQSLGTQLALPLRRAMEQNKRSNINALLGGVTMRPDISALALADTDGRILHASHHDWQGLLIEEVLPAAMGVPLQAPATLLRQYDTLFSTPIRYSSPDSDKNPKSRELTLWLLMEADQAERHSMTEATLHFALFFVPSVLILLLISWVTQRYIIAPLQLLLHYARRLTYGDYDARQPTRGNGEFAQLSAALHTLSQKTSEIINDLRDREQRLAITLNSIGDAVMTTDVHGLVTRLNPQAEVLTGWTEAEAKGRPVIEIFRIINAGTRQPVEHPIGRVLREGMVVGLANHTVLISRDGTEYQIADSAAPIRDERDDSVAGVIMVFQDVTGRYETEAALASAHVELQALTRALPDPCFLLSKDGEYLDIFGGKEELLAETRKTLLGKKISRVLPPESAEPIMTTIATTLQTTRPQVLEYSLDVPAGTLKFEGHTAPFSYNGQPAVIWLARDITRRWQAEQDVVKLANYDPLTGLPNRRMLKNQLTQSMSRARRSGHFAALLFIDLDHFKTINDSLGHQYGDQVLVSLAQLLQDALRSGDHLSRFGGDEFIVILEDLGEDLTQASERASAIAAKLNNTCTEPMKLDGKHIQLALSIGVVLFPDHANANELIKRADIAMYRAKDTGRNRICFFSADLQQIAEQRLIIQSELRDAITHDQLRLFVEPKADRDGNWISGEILVRWQHPSRGLLSPEVFLPIAEETGLVLELDNWVIEHTIEALGKLSGDARPGHFLGLSINVSGPSLTHSGFASDLRYVLAQQGVEAHLLEIEITERLLLEDYSTSSEVMDELHQLGLRFSIDDFGTGYSSLRYLQRLPLDTLKIDKSFISRLPLHQGDAILVESILDLAHHLGLKTVAEGIETEEQRVFLAERGCQQFQGYLYSRPIPWDEFVTLLEKESQQPAADSSIGTPV